MWVWETLMGWRWWDTRNRRRWRGWGMRELSNLMITFIGHGHRLNSMPKAKTGDRRNTLLNRRGYRQQGRRSAYLNQRCSCSNDSKS
jgi:hypothetical protein